FLPDTYDGAASNPDRCRLRASEYFTYCANTTRRSSKLTFIQAGVPTVTEKVGNYGCNINVAACANGYIRAGAFLPDTYDGAASNPDRCRPRVSSYVTYFCNTSGQMVTATFIQAGVPTVT